jgi:hypothetical protein
MDKIQTENAFSLVNMKDETVKGSISWVSDNMIFVPYNNLKPFESYRIIIKNTASDIMNNAMEKDFFSSFKLRCA